jgi:hypothetical protein
MNFNLELETNLAASVDAAAKARGVSSREFIRQALQHAAAQPVSARCAPFFQKAHDFGAHVETPWTVLAELETDEHLQKNARR